MLKKNPFNHRLIVIEGISGAGKTTISKMLAETLGAAYLECPPKILDIGRTSVDSMDKVARFHFYLTGNIIASRMAEQALQESDVVMDRYVFTTICWFHEELYASGISLESLGLLEPDYKFLLTVSDENVRRKRVRASERRFSKSDQDLETEGSEKVKLYLNLLTSHGLQKIDTSRKTSNAVERFIMSKINS